MSEHILTEQKNGILNIRINRPDKKNALTVAMYSALVEAFAQATKSADIRVVFITGTGDSFTAGNDLNDFLQNPPSDENSPVTRFLYAISHFEKAIVTAVNGLAIGVGTTMLLHSDLVYSSETARFQLPFVNLGLVPEAASSYIIPRMMGRQRAAELFLLGEMFSAQKAHEVGIVNELLAPDELPEYAWQKALALAEKPPEALRLTKMLLRKGEARDITAVMQSEGQYFRQQLGSPEAKEVMMAFIEKRKPDFSKM